MSARAIADIDGAKFAATNPSENTVNIGTEIDEGDKRDKRDRRDRKGDKKKILKRTLNQEAIDCIRRYRNQKTLGGKRPNMRAICQEYAEKISGLLRVSTEPSRTIKACGKGTKRGHSDLTFSSDAQRP